MKKLVLFFAAVVAIAFASCGAKETTEEATEEVAVEEVAPVVADTAVVAVDSAAVVAE